MFASSLLITETCEISQKGSFLRLSVGNRASIGLNRFHSTIKSALSHAGFLCGVFLSVLTTVQFFKFVTVSAFAQSIALDARSRILALHFEADWLQITVIRI